MPIEQYTYWSMTINNPDENDYVLIRNPNDKYIRQLVWTPEEGEEGTPHIQAWVRLQRNQTFSFMKKLFPRAHIKACTKDEHVENTMRYAQKNDATTVGAHVITVNDPFPDSVQVILRLLTKWDKPITAMQLARGDDAHGYFKDEKVAYDHLRKELRYLENDAVVEKPYLAKFFVSPVYEKTLSRFWKQFLYHIYNNYTLDGAQDGETQDLQGGDCSEGHSDEESGSETDEGSGQGSSSDSDEEDASSEC